MENVKIRLSVLWIFVAINMSAILIVSYMAPGMMEEIMAGEVFGMPIGHAELFIMAFTYFWIPAAMAVLSLILKNKGCRWTNIIVGVVFTIYVIIELIMNLTTIAYPFAVFMDVSAIVALALVVWYAWKWE